MICGSDVLFSALRADLADHIDSYQFSLLEAGGAVWPDATWQQVACTSLYKKILSKCTEDGEPPEAACQAALTKFLSVNERCKGWKFVPEDERDEVLFGTLRDTLWHFFNPEGYSLLDSWEELVSLGGVGPGASVSARGDDLYTKVFDSPLTSTEVSLLDIWEHTVSADDRWFRALWASYHRHIPRTVGGNQLSFVSKNQLVARTICTEPTINMWFQLGIGAKMTERLRTFFNLNLSNQQDFNRLMAEAASRGADFCTIDLESASDSVSLGLLEAILPPGVLRYLLKTRSPTTRLPSGETVELGMVSTMGNGFTFPLQTIIFAAIVSSVYRFLGIPLKKRGMAAERNFAVFGDDIICSKAAYRLVVRLLALCGFKVNEDKSFSQGLFYESCGGDYFDGHSVRPFYIKRLSTHEDLYKAINGLNRWSAMTQVPLRHTVQVLLALCKVVHWVPWDMADDAGIHVPLAMVRGKGASPRCLQHGLVGFSYRRPMRLYLLVKEDYIQVRKGVGKRRSYNPDGLWLSFLHGSVRGYQIGLRQRTVRYTTRRGVTPMWDSPSPQLRRQLADWRSFASYASYNLSVEEVWV